jgi:hypothetical protein
MKNHEVDGPLAEWPWILAIVGLISALISYARCT